MFEDICYESNSNMSMYYIDDVCFEMCWDHGDISDGLFFVDDVISHRAY
jgi:hypothetical protein